MIKVVEQSTADRKKETKNKFEKIKPYLDKGYTYRQALEKAGISTRSLNRYNGWFRDLIEYGVSQGYLYKNHAH